MTIRNPDGSEYKVTGSMQQFDPENPEIDVFNLWDEEAIEIAGSPLEYYEIFINISNIDELYVEARDKIWSQIPIQIYGYYDPIPSSNEMSVFGIGSPDELMFEFNYRYILKTLGHVPKIGARIFSPHRQENWEIIQCNAEVFKLWGELRIQAMCRRFQENRTTQEGKVTQRRPDWKMNSIKDLQNSKMDLAGGQQQIP